jgi:soluble lytic murein transglycosylase
LCRAYAAISGRFIVHARDPKVDWVEQIPFSETRNYVQRIMENLQVYRARFGGGTRLQIEADLHRGASVQ